MTRQSNMSLQIFLHASLADTSIIGLKRQPMFRARALDRFGAFLDGDATRRGAGLVGDMRATGCSAAKLLFNTSIKLRRFWAEGAAAMFFFGSSARLSLSFEIKTVR
jgi:hypothetical protein